MNNLKKRLIIIIPIIIIIGVVAFYYRIGVGFGKAIPKAVKGVYEANEEWKARNENPLDSIKDNIVRIVDSTELRNTKNYDSISK